MSIDRRSEPRLSIESPVQVQVLRPRAVEYTGTVVNVSAGGLRIIVPKPLESGEVVRIIADTHQTMTVVRHCQKVASEYLVGLERTDEWVMLSEIAAPQTAEAGPEETPAEAKEAKTTHQLKTHFGDVRTAAIRELFDKSGKKAKLSRSVKMFIAGAAAGALMLAAALGVKFLGPDSSLQESAAAAPAPAPAVPQPGPAPATAAGTQVNAPEPIPPPIAAPTPAQRKVTLRASANSWVLACGDDQKIFERLVSFGETVEFTFVTKALLRSGNAGALEVSVDAGSLGTMGARGESRAWRITPAGNEEIPPTSARNCTNY